MDIESDSECGYVTEDEDTFIFHPKWLEPLFDKLAEIKAQEKKELPACTVQKLADFVQNAEPAIRSKIYNFTFSFGRGIRWVDDQWSDYKVPAVLQVSRATRRKAARSYYKNTTFFVCVKIPPYAKIDVPRFDSPGLGWLRSLSRAHRGMLREVRMVCCHPSTYHDISYAFPGTFSGLTVTGRLLKERWLDYAADVVTYGFNGHVPRDLPQPAQRWSKANAKANPIGHAAHMMTSTRPGHLKKQRDAVRKLCN